MRLVCDNAAMKRCPAQYWKKKKKRVISTVLFALVVFLVYGPKDFKGLDEPRNAIMTASWKLPNSNEFANSSHSAHINLP